MDATDTRLLNRIQREFPLVERPDLALAEELDLTEQEVLDRVDALKNAGVIRSIGPVFDPPHLGLIGVLVAAEVEENALDCAAKAVSALPEVTHNYLRDHRVNLWFTVMVASQFCIQDIVTMVERQPGVKHVEGTPDNKEIQTAGAVRYDFGN